MVIEPDKVFNPKKKIEEVNSIDDAIDFFNDHIAGEYHHPETDKNLNVPRID